jgi:BASS family bile acid:Na+ symporter
MVILIVLPLILSRFILRANLQTRIAPIKGLLTDWSFFIVLYTIIGVNSSLIFENPLAVAPSVFVAFAATFILGFLIERLARAFNMDRQKTMSLVLLGTLKNQGIAGGLALSVFPQETALPAAAYTVFMFLFFMWLDVRRRLRAPLRRLAGAD